MHLMCSSRKVCRTSSRKPVFPREVAWNSWPRSAEIWEILRQNHRFHQIWQIFDDFDDFEILWGIFWGILELKSNLTWLCWAEDLLQNTLTADFLSCSRKCLSVLTKTARHRVLHLNDGRADIEAVGHHTIWCHKTIERNPQPGSGNVTIEEMVTYAYRSEVAWMHNRLPSPKWRQKLQETRLKSLSLMVKITGVQCHCP